jgi:hypothetical protein
MQVDKFLKRMTAQTRKRLLEIKHDISIWNIGKMVCAGIGAVLRSD